MWATSKTSLHLSWLIQQIIQISALFSYHRRSFLPQHRKKCRDPQPDVTLERESLECKALNRRFPSNPSPQSYGKPRKKECRSGGHGGHRENKALWSNMGPAMTSETKQQAQEPIQVCTMSKESSFNKRGNIKWNTEDTCWFAVMRN